MIVNIDKLVVALWHGTEPRVSFVPQWQGSVPQLVSLELMRLPVHQLGAAVAAFDLGGVAGAEALLVPWLHSNGTEEQQRCWVCLTGGMRRSRGVVVEGVNYEPHKWYSVAPWRLKELRKYTTGRLRKPLFHVELCGLGPDPQRPWPRKVVW